MVMRIVHHGCMADEPAHKQQLPYPDMAYRRKKLPAGSALTSSLASDDAW
jgi:hypothetical protein